VDERGKEKTTYRVKDIGEGDRKDLSDKRSQSIEKGDGYLSWRPSMKSKEPASRSDSLRGRIDHEWETHLRARFLAE